MPLVLKIAPDLDTAKIRTIAEAVRRHGIDGVIATNTSVSREGVEKLPHANEAGGLSGAPIRGRATGVEGIVLAPPADDAHRRGREPCGADAAEKRSAGAHSSSSTGLIYRGPSLVGECVSAYRTPQKVGYLIT